MTADSDRALRRLIVELSGLDTSDRAAVLGTLDPRERRAADRLLKEFEGCGRPAENCVVAGLDTRALSPWLVRRLQSEPVEHAITASARDALRACAVALYPAVVRQRRQGVLSRLGAALASKPA